MKSFKTLLALTSIIGLSAPAAFAQLDSGQPILCVIMEAKSCEARSTCESGGAALVNLPDFVTIDVDAGKLAGKRPDGTDLMTPIERMETADEVLMLQGGENGVGWSITLNMDNGRMIVSASTDEAGMLLFGACTQ